MTTKEKINQMSPCQEYIDAPNPKPKPTTQVLWALSDTKGRYARLLDGSIRLFKRKPEGGFPAACTTGGKREVHKPRRVRVMIEAI